MNDLPREICETLMPEFEVLDEFEQRVNGCVGSRMHAYESDLSPKLATRSPRAAFLYGVRAPRA